MLDTIEYSLSTPYMILDWPEQKILQGPQLSQRLLKDCLPQMQLQHQLGIKVTHEGIIIMTDFYSSIASCLSHFQQLFRVLKKNLGQFNLTPIALSAHPEISTIQRPCITLKHSYLWREQSVRDEIAQRFFAYAPALSALSTCGWFDAQRPMQIQPIVRFENGDNGAWKLHLQFFDSAIGIYEYQSYFAAIIFLLKGNSLFKKDNEQNAKLRMLNTYQLQIKNEYNTLLLNDFFQNIPEPVNPLRLLYDRWKLKRNPALEIRERFINNGKSLHPLYWERCIMTVD